MRTFYPYEDIRHFACLHSADSVDLRSSMEACDAELLFDGDVPIQFGGEKFTALVHPRWCPRCVAQRTAVLRQGLLQRLERIDLFTDIEAIRRNEKSYIRGVVRARVEALTIALDENEQADITMDEDVEMLSEAPAGALIGVDQQIVAAVETGEVQALINSMFEARLSEGDEELVGLMNRWSVTDDQMDADELHMVLEVELELALIVHRAEQQGIEDGRMLQARLEQVALSLDTLDARERLLEQALI